MAGLITGIVGLTITAGTTAASFAQANKQMHTEQKTNSVNVTKRAPEQHTNIRIRAELM